MLKDEEIIRQTGEWWIDDWWLKNNWLEVIPRSPTQVTEAFEYLKSIFDAKWLRAYKGDSIENTFLRSIIYDRSAFQRAHLILLGERLKRLRDVSGIHVIINGLRGRGESDAADMELELADGFFQEGYKVEFPIPKPSKGKSPDIRLIKGNDRLVIECKRLRVGELPAWLNSAYSTARRDIFDLVGARDLCVKFQFDFESLSRLLDARTQGLTPQDAAAILVNRVEEQLELASSRGQWPVWIFLENLGFGFFYVAESKAGSTVSNPDTPNELLFPRLLSNALRPAIEQVQNEDSPAVVAIHARDIPSEQYLTVEINRFMNLNRERCANIVGVLVLPWQGWFQRNKSFFITNRFSQFDWHSYESAQVLRKYFDPIIL